MNEAQDGRERLEVNQVVMNNGLAEKDWSPGEYQAFTTEPFFELSTND